MRYFAELSYRGTPFHGWQRQPNAPSVQQTLEEAFSTVLNTSITFTGCGRTDAGVHALKYFAHFDFEDAFPSSFLRRINKFLPPEIAVGRIVEVAREAHARFDAVERSYVYRITLRKDPFAVDSAYHFPFADKLDLDITHRAARLLLNFSEFFPFCKSHSDAKTMRCDLRQAEWIVKREELEFHIAADRFLRGMVRLIVGMCLNAGLGKVQLAEVERALAQQQRLDNSWSVPPQGLFLNSVKYPYL
ncbi:MAG: tRNA pseudouridine(38-40) synthase TruA [Saprospiraceae bacterium]|nr:tRNA pseudouridine(38-40) synthase TruA [Saprospiraceae bacterium]